MFLHGNNSIFLHGNNSIFLHGNNSIFLHGNTLEEITEEFQPQMLTSIHTILTNRLCNSNDVVTQMMNK